MLICDHRIPLDSLKAVKNVKFPDSTLSASRPFDRGSLSGTDFEELADEITIKWEGLVQVRRLRVDIPVVIDYEAKEGEVAEFKVKELKYKGANEGSFQYEAWAKPQIIRWKVAPPAPVKVQLFRTNVFLFLYVPSKTFLLSL